MNIREGNVDARFVSAEYSEQLFLPEPPLDQAVNNFYCFNSRSSSETIVKHLSPNLEMMLVFSFGNPVRISFGNEILSDAIVDKVAVIGPLKRMLNYEITPGTDVIVVNFRLNGFHRLFNIPVSGLDLQAVKDPDTLIGKKIFNKLWRQLSAIKTPQERINEMILQVIPSIKPNSDQITTFLKGERFFYDPALNPAKAIASETRLTERMIQMKFQEHVGYSPKELIRFLRFKQVVLKLISQETGKLDVFEMIETQGYYDQSHLIKDFNHFLGTTPRKFFRSIREKVVCTTVDDGRSAL